MNNRICSELITNLYTSTIPALYDEIKKIKSDKKVVTNKPSDNITCGCDLTQVYDQIERVRSQLELKIDRDRETNNISILELQHNMSTCFDFWSNTKSQLENRIDEIHTYSSELSNQITGLNDRAAEDKRLINEKIDAYSNLHGDYITDLQRDVGACFEYCEDINLQLGDKIDNNFAELSNQIIGINNRAVEDRRLIDEKIDTYHTYCDDYRQQLDDKIETYYSDINSSIAEVSERVTMYHTDPNYTNEDRLQKIEKDVEELSVKITELQSVLSSLTSRGADHNR